MFIILREEIVCLAILLFLLFYYNTNKIKEKGYNFNSILYCAILHIVFDIITVITVNNMGTIHELINRAAHIVFYSSGVFLGYLSYRYILRICAVHKQFNMMESIGFLPIPFYYVMLLVIPMQYEVTEVTNHSSGLLAVVGFALFLGYALSSLVIVFISHKKLDDRVKWAVCPMTVIVCIVVVIQAIHPEYLMTGASATFICLGIFVAMDNPDKKYKEQALWDFLTGIKNRNCYTRDMEMYEARYSGVSNRRRIGFIVADLNNLKKLNDTHGHIEGDKLISSAANILRDSLKTADNIYRIGGDEFVAVYLSPNDDTVRAEIDDVWNRCRCINDLQVPLEIAIGYHAGLAQNTVSEILNEADKLMYLNKRAIKGEK